MKNTKLSISLIACLLSVGGLAGCSKVKSSSDGVLLTYTVDGKEHKITADQILEKSYDDSSKYQAIYDVIYSVLVKNYFNREAEVDYYGQKRTIGKGQMGNKDDVAHGSEGSIYGKANQKVEDDIDTAHTNADANNTRYKKELETILSSHGVKTVEELKEKYVEEIQKETFEKNFYTYYIEDMKRGAGATNLWGQPGDTTLKDFWAGYFEDQMPYHVSHILVKLEDGSGTNYADGTVSEANAKKLYDVVDALANSEDTFSTIAKQYSEDPGSRVLSGDLGIMDTSTSFVNEFKLGVYAYENYYGKDTAETVDTKIDAQEFAANYEAAVEKSFTADELANDVPVISSDVFKWLKDAADEDKDADKEEVLDNNAAFYPRNIIYNKFLNRHSVAFITGKTEAADDATHGYHTYTEGKLAGAGKILSVKVAGEWRPILCVRAGSDYQGIHFIVVNRSPLETGVDANGVNQSEYYTTFYPDQDLYPHTGSGDSRVNKKTYINFSSKDSDVTATKKRAEELASKLKSFDSDRLGKYIFRKYLAEERVVINQTKLADSLQKWIDTSVEKAAAEREENWSKTWNEYIDTLSRQGSERSKLVPQACRIGFAHANDKNTNLWSLVLDEDAETVSVVKKDLVALGWIANEDEAEEFLAGIKVSDSFKNKGGLCNDGKAHL
jgi:hypothetical protein